MKDKFGMIGVFFLLMASLPLLLSVRQTGTSPRDATAGEASHITAAAMYAAALCPQECSDEALRAVAIILKTNLIAGESMPPAENTAVAPALQQRIQAIFDSNNEILVYQDKPAAVPLFACSNGVTAGGDRPYLCAAAAPWDAFAGASDVKAAAGVSVNGLCRLCDCGLRAEEALRWFLPQLRVTQFSGAS